MWIDIIVKLAGFIIAMIACPPLTLFFVIVAGLLPSIVAHRIQKKAQERAQE